MAIQSDVLKSGVKSLLKKMGYEIRRQTQPHHDRREMSHLESVLTLLLTRTDKTINIVQVGANDGSINDPLFAFTSKYPDRTKILLVEPQKHLVPFLKKNYDFHKAAHIFNGAIGPENQLELHRIRKCYWKDFQPSYSAGWPEYRAPTGVTSANISHVENALRRHYKGSEKLADVIETEVVECLGMADLISRTSLFDRLDVLQVDAEGFDDQVIFSSSIPQLKPLVINFEAANLTPKRMGDLDMYLGNLGYVVSWHGFDALAILTRLD
jgi:FkbM family methyltransferase